MTIRDRDRKLLWAKSHNACAMCGCALVEDRTPLDREAIVGDEAHIISGSPNGPRGAVPFDGDIDAYDNLILLCKVHHKIIDDQPETYSAERLRDIKSRHERAPHAGDVAAPLRLKPDPDHPAAPLRLLASGRDIWDVIHVAQASRWSPLSDSSDDELVDLGDEFLDIARDYIEVSDVIHDQGQRAIREACRTLDDYVQRLAERGVAIFGGRVRLLLTGGVGADSTWWEARLVLLPLDEALLRSSQADPAQGEPMGHL